MGLNVGRFGNAMLFYDKLQLCLTWFFVGNNEAQTFLSPVSLTATHMDCLFVFVV